MTQQPPPYGGPAPHPPAVPPPYGGPPPVAPPPREAWWRPQRVEPVPGTPYGLVHLAVAPVTSGLAVGSVLAGGGSILVGLLVLCFGLIGAQAGWGLWVAGAFAVLAFAAGAGAVGLGLAGRRQIRRSGRPPAVRFTGLGIAVSGLSCGVAGMGITVLCLALTLLVQLG